MRVLTLLLLTTSLVAVAGCHPHRIGHGFAFGMARRPLSVGDRLVCPDQVGDLQRSAQAADGLSCAYSGPRNEAVQLSLTALGGADVETRLASLETTLKAELPAAASSTHGPGVYVGHDKGSSEAHIDFPGFHLNASDDKASIRLPGVAIDSDGGDAKVSTGAGGQGGTEVQAHNGGAEIRTGGVNANGAELTYLLASDTPGPTGYRVVGYRAKGPAKGPLVVAVFRARGQGRHDDNIDNHELDKLIDMNVHS